MVRGVTGYLADGWGYGGAVHPAVIVVLIAIGVAFGLSLVVRNTSGTRPTGQPGALAGNLALVLFGAIALIVVAAVLLG